MAASADVVPSRANMSPLGWVGFSLIAIALYAAWREHQCIRRSEIVKGLVFPRPRGSIRGKPEVLAAPEIVFETRDGRTILLHGKLDPADGVRYAASGVAVAYFPDHPQRARVLVFGYRYGFWLVVAAIGVWLLCLDYGFRHGDDMIRRMYVSSVQTVSVE